MKANEITINKGELSVYTQKMSQLTASISPSNTSNKEVSWSSSDPAIASVDQTGLVIGLKAGKATITATTKDGSNLSAHCEVEVLPAILVDSITMQTEARLNKGGKLVLSPVVLPEDVGNKELTWSTSDENVATVENGLVTAAGFGTATIIATAEGGATATCVLTVDATVNQLRAVAYGLGVSTTNQGRYLTFNCGAQFGTPPYTMRISLTENGNQLTAENLTTNGVEDLQYFIGNRVIDGLLALDVEVTDANGQFSTARTAVKMYVNGWNISTEGVDETPILVVLPGDANDSKSIDMGDVIAIIDYLVDGTPCKSMRNANADQDPEGNVDLSDLLLVINQFVNP